MAKITKRADELRFDILDLTQEQMEYLEIVLRFIHTDETTCEYCIWSTVMEELQGLEEICSFTITSYEADRALITKQ